MQTIPQGSVRNTAILLLKSPKKLKNKKFSLKPKGSATETGIVIALLIGRRSAPPKVQSENQNHRNVFPPVRFVLLLFFFCFCYLYLFIF